MGDRRTDPDVRPYDDGRGVLASYTCTPLVHFPLADLIPGGKTVGRTVADLGAMNQPLDMISSGRTARNTCWSPTPRTAC